MAQEVGGSQRLAAWPNLTVNPDMTIATVSPSIHQRIPLASTVSAGLSWPERACLAVGIFEIPLQIDKYFMFHEPDAMLGAVGGINVSITTLMLAALYTMWMVQWSVHRTTTGRLILGVPMLCYLCSVLLSSLSSTLPWLSIFDFVLLAQAYLLFFYIANRVRTRFDLVFCLLALAATLLMQAVIIFGLAALRIDHQEIELGPLVLTVWEGMRHGGTMQSPVLAGSTMALIWLPVAVLVICHIKPWAWRIALLATAMGLLAILLTQTRGAIVTSAVGSLIIGGGMFLRGWLPRWVVLIAALLAGLSAYPLVVVYQQRIREGDGDSAIARKHLSLIAVEMISKRPVFGYGAGNCHLAGQRFADQSKYRSEWYYTIHSKYLLVWIETGLIGIGFFLWILANGFYQGWAAWRLKDRLLAPIGLALAAALAGHGIHMAVDIFNSRTQVQMLWVMLGLLAAVYHLARQEYQRPQGSHQVSGQATGLRPWQGGLV